MRVTILNGNPTPAEGVFGEYLAQFQRALESRGHLVSALILRDMEITPCVGCFGCWVRTPGECVVPDASAEVCRAVIQSDLTVFASPLVMGYVSAVMKKAMDKLLPLILPYFAVIHHETHHRRRYERYPALGVLLEAGAGGDQVDVEITERLFERFAINFHASLQFVAQVGDPLEEVVDAVETACRD